MRKICIFMFMLALIFAVSISAATASAADTVSSGTCGAAATWTLDSEGTLTISGSGAITDYSSTKSPFYYNASIKKVIIGDEITSIGTYLFRRANNLEHVTIGNSVTTISNKAFYQCPALKTVIMSASVTSVGPSAFANSTAPKNVYISDMDAWCNILFLDGASNPLNGGGNLYLNNNLVTDFVLSDNYTGKYTFIGCASLKTVTITDKVTYIPSNMFRSCTSLQKIDFSDSVTTIDEYAFAGCSALQNITIPDGVTTIEDNAFASCEAVKTLTVGQGLTMSDQYAFAYLYNLESVLWNAKNIQSVGGHLFTQVGTYGDGVDFVFGENVESIPNSVLSFYVNAPGAAIGPGDNQNVRRVTIGKNVSSIGERAFSGLYTYEYVVDKENKYYSAVDGNLYNFDKTVFLQYARRNVNTEFAVPQGVTKIASYAFSDLITLEKVILPDTVKVIGAMAFNYCYDLENVVFGNGLTDIEDNAFEGCLQITGIDFPDSLINIGSAAFKNCTGLKSLYINNHELIVGGYAFSYCDALESVNVNCKSIGDSAFLRCTALKTITIGENVESVGSWAFYENISLEKVWWNAKNAIHGGKSSPFIPNEKECVGFELIFGDSVERIPEYILTSYYSDKPVVKSITFGKNVKSVGAEAFNGCKIPMINMPCIFEYIGESAFSSANLTLDTITITGSVEKNAFYGCENLHNVIITDGSIGDWSFSRCSNLKTVTIGENVTGIGTNAFSICTGLEKVYWNAKNAIATGEFAYCFEGAGSDSAGIDVVFGESVESIPEKLFYGYDDNSANVKTVIIGSNVKQIGYYLFIGSENIEKVYWNAKNAEIVYNEYSGEGMELFYYTIPADVIFGDDVETIPQYAFWNCSYLKSVTFGNKIKKIGFRTFGYCSDELKIILPETIENIENQAFYYCRGTLYYSGSESDFNEKVTMGTDNHVKMIYAEKKGEKTSVSDDGKVFFVDCGSLEKENNVILALYKNGIFTGFDTAVYTDGNIVFETDKEYTDAKVMVWQNMDSLIPVCNAEAIQ